MTLTEEKSMMTLMAERKNLIISVSTFDMKNGNRHRKSIIIIPKYYAHKARENNILNSKMREKFLFTGEMMIVNLPIYI